MDGVSAHAVQPDQLQIQFLGGNEVLKLVMLVALKSGRHGNPVLSNVKVLLPLKCQEKNASENVVC